MRMIRPKTIDGSVVAASNIAESPGPAWASGTTYAAAATAAKPLRSFSSITNVVGMALSAAAMDFSRVTMLSADPISTWSSAQSIALGGACTVAFQLRQTANTCVVSLYTLPGLTDVGTSTAPPASLYFPGPTANQVESGVTINSFGAYTTADYFFINRDAANVVTYWKGATADIAAATLLATKAAALPGTLYVYAGLVTIGTAIDIRVQWTDPAVGNSWQIYQSLQAGNIGNDPDYSPAWWAEYGTADALWSSGQVYLAGQRVTEPVTHRTYESQTGTAATVTMTIASPCVVTHSAHGLAANTPVRFTTTGALPTGLSPGVTYYVLAPTANSYTLSSTPGGTAINTSGSQSGIHTITANPNLGLSPVLAANAAVWVDAGPTNRFALFDNLNATVTTHPSVIDVTLAVPGRNDSIALLNVANAASLRVIVTDPVVGVVYDVTTEMTSTAGIDSWFDYFFEEVVQRSAIALWDLPVYSNATIRAILTGVNVQAGVMVVGQSKSLGETIYDSPPELGITDYSRPDEDEFGNISIKKRAFAKKATFQAALATSEVDPVQRLLEEFRSTPAVWEGSDQYESGLIFGFYGGFRTSIKSPTVSYLDIDIKGLI